MINFGYEYVWHCHILGHEENDMMRAMILGVAPAAPSNLAVIKQLTTPPSPLSRAVKLQWTDNSNNETGFTVQRSADNAVSWPVSFNVTAPNPAGKGGTVTFYDTTVQRNRPYWYRVMANNVVGDTQPYAAPAVGYPWVSYDSALVTRAGFDPLVPDVVSNNVNGLGTTFSFDAEPLFIFANGFENGTAGWAGVTGDVQVIPQAAMGPNAAVNGMAANLSSNPAYVTDASLNNETSYFANFYFNPNTSDSGSNPVDIFVAKDQTDQPAFGIQYRLDYREMEPEYEIRGWVMHGSTKAFTAWTEISNDPHYLEVTWQSGVQGGFSLFLDDYLIGTATGNSGTQTLTKVLLGPSGGLSDNSTGTMFFDDFSSVRVNAVTFNLFVPILTK